jgi:23S rRNA maturation-related 3'-5' exoribonuclease YhaM
MNDKIIEIRKLLSQILNELEATKQKIEQQSGDIKAYIEKCDVNLDKSQLLIAEQRSTRTSIELLRDEIEELHQVVKIIFNEINDKTDKKDE